MNFNGFILMFRLFALVPVLPSKSMVSRLLELYSLLMILYDCFVFYYIFHISTNFAGNSVFAVVAAILVFMLIVTHVAIVLQAYTSRKTQVNILQMVDDIDSVMIDKLFLDIVPRRISKKLACELISVIAMLLVSYVHFFAFISDGGDIFILLTIIGTTRMRCIQMLFYVGLLCERLERINDELSRIVNGKTLYRNAMLKNEFYERLVVLKNLYGCIWDYSKMLNDCFGWSFVAVATEHFVETLSNGHVIFIALVAPGVPNSLALNAFFGCIPAIFTFTMVCISCHFCTEKALKTAELVTQIESSSLYDEEFCNILQEFSLQIRHEPIIINANGYFTVNLELLSRNWATAVMYLLILIQFQQSEHFEGNGNLPESCINTTSPETASEKNYK